MAKHAAIAHRSPWRPFALAVVAALVLTGTSTGVYALLRAQATGTQGVATGTLHLTLAKNGTFGTPVTGAAPGDLLHRFVTVTNSGTLAAAGLTLAATGAGAPELTTVAASSLRVAVTACTGPWSPGTGLEGTCNGTATTLLSSAPLSALGTPQTLLPLSTTVAAGQVHHLRISLRVPDNNEVSTNGTPAPGSVQGKSADLTFTFTEDQRTGTVSSS